MSILRSFPKFTAAGPSGLRIQHLIDAAEAYIPLQIPLQSLKAVINLLTSGNAPKELAIYLAGGNVTALNQANSGDILPIAVGESFALPCRKVPFVLLSKGRLRHSSSLTSMEWPAPVELKELFMAVGLVWRSIGWMRIMEC